MQQTDGSSSSSSSSRSGNISSNCSRAYRPLIQTLLTAGKAGERNVASIADFLSVHYAATKHLCLPVMNQKKVALQAFACC
jgi:hypothetical protein